jgi:hypothetical protein
LVGDLLLEFCLFGGSDDVGGGSIVEEIFCLPLWLLLAVAADSAGAKPNAARSLGCCSFVGGTKWYGCRAS